MMQKRITIEFPSGSSSEAAVVRACQIAECSLPVLIVRALEIYYWLLNERAAENNIYVGPAGGPLRKLNIMDIPKDASDAERLRDRDEPNSLPPDPADYWKE